MIFIHTTSNEASYYFALEEYIMKSDKFTDEYFLFWRTEPTLMIGRFQNSYEEINPQFVQKNKLNVTRRNSGGGTIYTDPDCWLFSFITKRNGRGFREFTEPVIEAIKSLGAEVVFNSRNDLTVNGKKFSGNAQFIHGESHLHHGSILFDTNLENLINSLQVGDEKFISKSIKSVRERVTNLKPFLNHIEDSTEFGSQFSTIINHEMESIQLTPEDEVEIDRIKRNKFDQWRWNFGKSPAFNFSNSKRFKGGNLNVRLVVNKGVIENVKIYGDFFANGDIDQICEAVKGAIYAPDVIAKILDELNIENLIHDITTAELISCMFE